MARTSITFEQVAAIANALYAGGSKDPGTAAIRAELVKRAGPGMQVGSPNTIQRCCALQSASANGRQATARNGSSSGSAWPLFGMQGCERMEIPPGGHSISRRTSLPCPGQ